MMNLKNSIAIAVALFSGVASAQVTDDLLIITGREGGSYYSKQGPKIQKFLKGVGLNSNFIPSTGSLENLETVAKGGAQIGIAQADAIMYFSRTKPQLGGKIEVGGALGEECVFLVSKKKGKVNSQDHLQTKGITIAAGGPGDGSRATWEYMGMLESGFKNPTPVDAGGATGLAQVVSGQVDAFLFVTNPEYTALSTHELFSLSRGNANLQFVPITDWDLNDKLPNGEAVYEFKSIVTDKGTIMDTKVATICTDSYVIYNTALSDDVKEKLSRAFLRMNATETK